MSGRRNRDRNFNHYNHPLEFDARFDDEMPAVRLSTAIDDIDMQRTLIKDRDGTIIRLKRERDMLGDKVRYLERILADIRRVVLAG